MHSARLTPQSLTYISLLQHIDKRSEFCQHGNSQFDAINISDKLEQEQQKTQIMDNSWNITSGMCHHDVCFGRRFSF